MKKFILSMVALMIATISYAQNMLVATLTHGDEITMYYGHRALSQAHNAAQSGDVINLSGGSFASVKITKGITLRGTGIDDVSPTYLSGDFSIEVPCTETNRLTMEGIRCPGKITMSGDCSNPYFVKCQFTSLYSNSFSMRNATFVNCIINGCSISGLNGTLQFINSYVVGAYLSNSASFFKNCLIRMGEKGVNDNQNKNMQIYNSIIYQTINMTSDFKPTNSISNNYFPSSTSCHNCVFIGYYYSQNSSDSGSSDNYYVHHDDTNAFTKVFKGYEDGGSTLFYNYELTDEAKKKYLGDDGTEVGIYGGVLPYNSIPSYPRITKMNVANKTTADGKLSVEIEVSAAE